MGRIVPGFIIGITISAALFLSIVAVAQNNISAFLKPAVIDIRQSVPVEAVINGATVPITVDVALQVSLSGPVTVTASDAATPVVSIATPTPASTKSNFDYEELARNTEDHIGELLWFSGTVEQVGEFPDSKDIFLKIRLDAYDVGDGIVVAYYKGSKRWLLKDNVMVKGFVEGRRSFDSLLGPVTVPVITATNITLLD